MALITLVNGNEVTASDLNNNFDEEITTLRTENKRDCGVFQFYTSEFSDTLSSTVEGLRVAYFVSPDDLELIEFGIQSTNSSSWQAVLSGPSVGEIRAGDGTTSATTFRYYSDATKPRQVLLKNAEYTLEFISPAISSTGVKTKLFVLAKALPRRM